METKRKDLTSLKEQLHEAETNWKYCDISQSTRDEINLALVEELDHHRRVAESRTRKKLIRLNKGNLKFPVPTTGYINMTNKTLTKDQEELLNFGLNCHVLSKPRPWDKRLETEILLDNIHQLAKDGKVTTEEGLQAELLREAGKSRGNYRSKIIDKRHIEAAKSLREDPDITLRRADKAAHYVLIPTEDYLNKTDTLLMDVTKFERITRNPIEEIKTKANRIVDTVNAKAGGLKLPKLVGNYGLDYCYGNFKTHKAGSPLRFSLSSATDFLDLLSNSDSNGVIASLDAESLFTHVPISRTINYILEEVYPENGVPKLDLPKAALKAMLELYTMEAPFVCPRGNMYRQIDGVAMGSPLGVLFANFFMGMVEKETFNCFKKPSIYARYIDDIFVKVDDKSELPILKDMLQEISGLNFTIEFSQENKLPFLDILV
ncbi:uncharacterized protein LOC143041315 [Oratosquilla oratoria]|uniref:uncharacterized protein LOC143041315 n=1 Tax=Oratosquilla oratoria TaxID=337810 RepID=UPI003F76E042